MEGIQLKAQHRTEIGKSRLKKLRREGRLPAVVYGPQATPVSLSVGLQEFQHLLQKGITYHIPIDLKIESNGGALKRVLIRDVKYDPVWGSLVHVDFYEMPKGRSIQLHIPIKVKGVPAGVADGGVMQWPVRKLRVQCMPDQIPGIIEVDVSPLGKGDSLHASDLLLPAGAKMVEKSNVTIVTVLVPKEEEIAKKPEEVAAAVEGAPAEGAAPAAGEGAAAAPEGAAKPGEKAPAKGAAKAGEKAAAGAEKAAGKGAAASAKGAAVPAKAAAAPTKAGAVPGKAKGPKGK